MLVYECLDVLSTHHATCQLPAARKFEGLVAEAQDPGRPKEPKCPAPAAGRKTGREGRRTSEAR